MGGRTGRFAMLQYQRLSAVFLPFSVSSVLLTIQSVFSCANF
jgi:hypothetical protein